MVKVKVTKPGVYFSVAGAETEQEIGAVLEFETVPAFLLNKVELLTDTKGKTLVTAGASEEEITARVQAEAKRIADAAISAYRADEGVRIENEVALRISAISKEEADLTAQLEAEQKAADEKAKSKK